MPHDPTDEEHLLRRAQHGDPKAFDSLVQRSEQRIARMVRARMGKELRQSEDSADIVQTALAAAFRDLPAFESQGEGSFLRWLGTVVENKIRAHLRDLKRQCRDPARASTLSSSVAEQQAAPDPSPSAAAAGREMEDRYRVALEQLEPVDREVLLLHLELGWTHQEIADALEIASADAVRKRTARAVARLGRLMGGSVPA
jgi:RNA polymerase sigma-70 factor (ECF subfamily)